MKKNKLTSFMRLVLLCVTFTVSSCGDNEVYDQELSLEVRDRGRIANRWVLKYPQSLKYDKDIEDTHFIDGAILRAIVIDSEGAGYGCYCAFKTLTKADLVMYEPQYYAKASVIMLRPMESECFPEWLGDDFESKIFDLQQKATERILTEAKYTVTDWKAEKPTVINGINVYVYTYKPEKWGFEAKHKVACLIKGKHAIELSMRASPEDYEYFESKFDKILATVEFLKIGDIENNQ